MGFQAVSSFNGSADLLIVLISGQKNLMVAVKSLQKGAFDYIIKDEFTAEKMELMVSKAVSIRAAWARHDRKTATRKPETIPA